MFDDVRLSHYFTSGFFLFSRDEPFLLGPTRTKPEVLSEAAADGHRWNLIQSKKSFKPSYVEKFIILGSAELYNNLGLCCFFAQQYDMTLTCFQVVTPILKHSMTNCVIISYQCQPSNKQFFCRGPLPQQKTRL